MVLLLLYPSYTLVSLVGFAVLNAIKLRKKLLGGTEDHISQESYQIIDEEPHAKTTIFVEHFNCLLSIEVHQAGKNSHTAKGNENL